MTIAIDFDDTLGDTRQTIQKFMRQNGVVSFETIEEKQAFYRKHCEEILKEIPLKEHVIEVLNELSKTHTLFIVTARNNFYSNRLEALFLEYVKEKNLPIQKVYFDCIYDEKRKKCVEIGADLFIDDDIENCYATAPYVDTLLFGYTQDGLKSVYSWKEVLDYVKEKDHGRENSNE